MKAVTYTKLRDGSWGIRSESKLPQTPVAVVKKSGEVKNETPGKLVWSGNGVYLYAIANSTPARKYQEPKGYSIGKKGRRYCCDECGDWHSEGDGTRCWETGMAH